jgi:ankyrin repeat protein
MWECLQQLLCEVDDGIDADKFGSDSTGKSWKDVDGDVKEADSEQGRLQLHFEKRHEQHRLLHGLQHFDVHGRSALHYMAALAHKAVLRYCFDKLGKEGARMLSVQDLWHLTPLHHAVAFERPATVELLMKHSTPQSRDLFRNPTPETQVTVWTLANGNEDVLYELERGIEQASEREYKAIAPPAKKRKKGYAGPDINIDVIDGDGAICLSD